MCSLFTQFRPFPVLGQSLQTAIEFLFLTMHHGMAMLVIVHLSASWQHALGIRILNAFQFPLLCIWLGVIVDVISHYVF